MAADMQEQIRWFDERDPTCTTLIRQAIDRALGALRRVAKVEQTLTTPN